MNKKTVPERTLERKKREAAALKANMKKRKAQTGSQATQGVQKPEPNEAK